MKKKVPAKQKTKMLEVDRLFFQNLPPKVKNIKRKVINHSKN